MFRNVIFAFGLAGALALPAAADAQVHYEFRGNGGFYGNNEISFDSDSFISLPFTTGDVLCNSCVGLVDVEAYDLSGYGIGSGSRIMWNVPGNGFAAYFPSSAWAGYGTTFDVFSFGSSITVSQVPEPMSAAILALGLLGAAVVRRKA
jgi:hypothetical protein